MRKRGSKWVVAAREKYHKFRNAIGFAGIDAIGETS